MPAPITRKLWNYIAELLEDSRSIGIVLFSCTIVSIVIANTGWGNAYVSFLEKEIHSLEAFHLPGSAKHWINDGLMALFFFVVGMEIKRELLTGELSSFRKAILPIAAAIGGMVVPAFIFTLLNRGTEFSNGWGITVATDIAFSLAVASLMGDKFPLNLKIFLMALSIIDDLGAILILAFFYGTAISGWWLLAALISLVMFYLLSLKQPKFGFLHFVIALATWYFVYNSGIHSTIAGVLLAFLIPGDQISTLQNKLHNLVNFVVLPLFALANTAIVFNPAMFQNIFSSMTVGIFLGLFVGKPVGVLLASWLLVKKKLAKLPQHVNWKQMAGAGILAGIGFSMSIFITTLAYTDYKMQDVAKLAILIGMIASVLFATLWIKYIGKAEPAATSSTKP